MPTHREVLCAPHAALQQRFRALVQEASRDARGAGRRFSLAIPGGSVVTHLLSALRVEDADWGATDIYWCDERAVAPTHRDSNYGASMGGWLASLADTGVRVHRMAGDAVSLDEAARDYARELGASLGEPPQLDIVVLGVGEDGHVASLFPGHPALRERDRWVLAVRHAPKPPSERLTLTLPVLTGARHVVLAAFGAGKHAAMRAALDDPTSTLPAAQVLQLATRNLVLLDDAAALAPPR